MLFYVFNACVSLLMYPEVTLGLDHTELELEG